MSNLHISCLDLIGGPICVDVMISSSSSLSLIVSSSFFSSSSLMSSHFVGTTNEGFTFFSSPYLLDSHLTSLDSVIRFYLDSRIYIHFLHVCQLNPQILRSILCCLICLSVPNIVANALSTMPFC